MAGSVEEADGWMSLAQEAISAARTLLEEGFYRETVSRSYYAMFYAAKAALALQDIHVHKHSAVIAAFGRHLANAGLVPRSLHKLLIAAFDDRGGADYELAWLATRDKARRRLDSAEEFVSAVSDLIHRQKADGLPQA